MAEHENGSTSSTWYYASNKQKCGPVTFNQLQGLAAAGTLAPSDMVLQDGATRWQPANSITELFPVALEATLDVPLVRPVSDRQPRHRGRYVAAGACLLAVGIGAIILAMNGPDDTRNDDSPEESGKGNPIVLTTDHDPRPEQKPLPEAKPLPEQQPKEPTEVAREGDEAEMKLAVGKGLHFLKQHQYEAAIEQLEKALTMTQRIHGAEDIATAHRMNDLAHTYLARKRYAKAEPLFLRSLQLREKLLGKEDLSVCFALSGLVFHYRDQGQYVKAEALATRSLQIRENKLGKVDVLVAGSLQELASVYMAQKEYAKAEPLLQRSLEIQEAKQGKDHLSVSLALTRLALLYQEQGKYEKAEDLFKRSLQIDEDQLGKQHIQVTIPLGHLVDLYKVQGQNDKAEPLHQRCLEIFKDRLKTFVEREAPRAKGRGWHRLAMDYYEECVKMAERIYGTAAAAGTLKFTVPFVKPIYELALLHKEQGEPEKAEPLFLRCLEIVEKNPGPIYNGDVALHKNLGEVYQAQGQYEKSEKQYMHSLRLIEDRYKQNPHATDVNNVLLRLVEVHTARKQTDQAEPFRQRILKNLDTVEKEDAKSAQSGSFGLLISHTQVALAVISQLEGVEAKRTMELRSRLGIYHFLLNGDYAKGERLLLEVLVATEKRVGKDHPDVADCLHKLAYLSHAKGDYARAAERYARRLQIREAHLGKNHPDLADSFNELALLYQAQEQGNKGDLLCRRLLEIWENRLGKDSPDLAGSLHSQAETYRAQGLYLVAQALCQRSLELREARLGKDHPDTIQSRQTHLSLKQIQAENLEKYETSASSGQSKDAAKYCVDPYGWDHPYRSAALYNIAAKSRTKEAAQFSLTIREVRLGKDHPDTAASLCLVGRNHLKEAQYSLAEPLLQRGLRIQEARLGKDHLDTATTLFELARLYQAQGQFDNAELLYRRCLDIREARLSKDDLLTADTLQRLGMLYMARNKPSLAEPLYQRCLAIREDKHGKNHIAIKSALEDLATLYLAQGAYDKAEALCQRSLEIIRARFKGTSYSPLLVRIHDIQAALHEARGEYDKALPLYLQTSTAMHRNPVEYPLHLLNLARVYAAQEQWDKAFEKMGLARLNQSRHVTNTLMGMAEVEQLDFLKIKDEPFYHMSLSLALQRREDVSGRTRSAYFPLRGKAISHRVLAERNLRSRNLAIPELAGTTQELLDVRQKVADLSQKTPDTGKLVETQKMLRELEAEEQRLSRELGQKLGAESIPHGLELFNTHQAIPADGVLIDIARFDVYNFQAKGTEKKWLPPRYAAWVIYPRGTKPPEGYGNIIPVQLIDLGEAEPIDRAVQQFQKAMHNAGRTIYDEGEADAEGLLRKEMKTIADLVLKPLLPHIDQHKRWLISPDASLWLVPWAALPLNPKEYVIEQHHISYLVNGRDLATARHPVETHSAVVLADADYNLDPPAAATQVKRLNLDDTLISSGTERSSGDRIATDWAALPGTAQEAATIGPKLTAWLKDEPRVFTKEKALERVLKGSPRPRVLVLSTHGYFLADQIVTPDQRQGDTRRLENSLLRCGLVLAGANRREKRTTANQDDGLLTGLEIVGLDLRGTELVVLSACDTGIGDVRNGEGVAGLRQAFQLAGARSVVASLWKVPDTETAQLMERFWDNLAKGMDRAQALHEAQKALIAERRAGKSKAAHPYFWAAFTFTGQWK